jgi:hypothetical protein
MSRRHHGRPHHGRHRPEGIRPAADPRVVPPATSAASSPEGSPSVLSEPPAPPAPPIALGQVAAPGQTNGAEDHQAFTNGHGREGSAPGNGGGAPADRPNGHATGPIASGGNGAIGANDERSNGCTAPQLRRFIKSRPYVPMHELRRRFAIDGGEDDVTQVRLAEGHVYVGLPQREGSLLGELLRGGEIGYELSFDPRAPIVVGVYPMRPVPRP